MSMDRAPQIDPSDARALRDAFGRFATGVTIITAMHAEGVKAITANSFSSVSLDPPLVLWSIAQTSRRFRFFAPAQHYAIHVRAADQSDLCQAVARDVDALAADTVTFNAEGVPLIDGCLARFECQRSDAFEAGDHTIVLGEVLRLDMRGGDALTFFNGAFGALTNA